MSKPRPASATMQGLALLRACWSVPSGIHAVTTLRGPTPPSPGADEGFDLSHHAPAGNRARLGAALSLPEAPFWLRQVHGTAVADAATAPVGTVADAAVSLARGRVLAVLTADCLPVVFCHPAGEALGIAHAGWRGLAAGVLEATVRALHAPPAQCVAWLGPAIGAAAFEVGDEVRAAFLASDGGCGDAFVANRPGHWLANLYALARRRLAAVGLHDVHGGGECTYSTPARYFSYRRDQASARMATIVWRSDDNA